VDKVQTMVIVSVTFSHILFCLLSTRDDLVKEAFVWLHMVRFRVIWFGMVVFLCFMQIKRT